MIYPLSFNKPEGQSDMQPILLSLELPVPYGVEGLVSNKSLTL